MKPSFVILLLTFSFFASLGSGKKTSSLVSNSSIYTNNAYIMSDKMKIQIGSSTFTATLFDNATVTAFKALLPISANMTELNGNEKYFDLSTNLPGNTSNPGTIHTGDLMIWGANTLVLFYKDFSTSYNYTRLGKIDDISGLAAAVGSGNISVRFELQ